MSEVSRYLDCGCAILRDGSRSWCPSCAEGDAPKAERTYSTEEDALIEALADYAHDSWSLWMRHQEREGGQAFWDTLPIELAERWVRQARTDYADLPESEKESDRKEARRILSILRRYGGVK